MTFYTFVSLADARLLQVQAKPVDRRKAELSKRGDLAGRDREGLWWRLTYDLIELGFFDLDATGQRQFLERNLSADVPYFLTIQASTPDGSL